MLTEDWLLKRKKNEEFVEELKSNRCACKIPVFRQNSSLLHDDLGIEIVDLNRPCVNTDLSCHLSFPNQDGPLGTFPSAEEGARNSAAPSRQRPAPFVHTNATDIRC
jgi:hypothetical protein